MSSIISVKALSKTYDSGFQALKGVNLEILDGEILALLGPNGAGKTTLIGIICGIVNPTEGSVTVGGHDIVRDYRASRSMIGLVPQELTTNAFERVWDEVSFSRGLFGKPANPSHIESVLRSLSLWEKKDDQIMTLSGGMKRRVLIAKALSHEPRILFLDEPTAGVDVELRQDMWDLVRSLRESGVTVILTTHYIEEAEKLCDRVAIMEGGEIIAIGTPQELRRKTLGQTVLQISCTRPLPATLPALPEKDFMTLSEDRKLISVHSDRPAEALVQLVRWIDDKKIEMAHVDMKHPTLEDVFIELTGRSLRE